MNDEKDEKTSVKNICLDTLIKQLLNHYNETIDLADEFEKKFLENQKDENTKRAAKHQDEYNDENNSVIEFIKNRLLLPLQDSLFLDTILKEFSLSEAAKKYYELQLISNYFLKDFLPELKNMGIEIKSIEDITKITTLINSLVDNRLTSNIEEVLNKG